MTSPAKRLPKSRLSLSDDDRIDLLLDTTYRGRRETYIPTEDPDIYLKVGNRYGKWILRRRLGREPEHDFPLGFWPHFTVTDALAEGRRIRLEDEAWAMRPLPAFPLRSLLARYEREKLAKLKSGPTAARGLRHVLGPLLDQDARTLEAGVLAAELTAVAARAPRHANRCRSYTRAFFRWAVRTELISNDPTASLPKFGSENRARRNLPLEEIAEVWRAADILGHPGELAVKLLILLPVSRTDLIQMEATSIHCGPDGMVWLRLNPTVRDLPSTTAAWRLPPLAAELISQAMAQRPQARWLLSETGVAPGINWTGCRRRIVEEINRRRDVEGRRKQTTWHFDDLQGSFEAIALTTLRADPSTAGRCQDHLHRFRSRPALDEALSQGGVDRACELLWFWNQLIWAATTNTQAEGRETGRQELQ